MKLIDITGQRFGKLVATDKTKLGTHTAYVCQCDCGSQTTVRSQSLRRGESNSCGCARAEKMRAEKTTHGHYEPGNCRWATRTEQNRNKRSTTKEQ